MRVVTDTRLRVVTDTDTEKKGKKTTLLHQLHADINIVVFLFHHCMCCNRVLILCAFVSALIVSVPIPIPAVKFRRDFHDYDWTDPILLTGIATFLIL